MIDPRVTLAAERTLLAWIRTGLALIGLGFVVARFGLFLRELVAAGHPPAAANAGPSLWIGTGIVALGVAVNVIAAAQHVRLVRRLEAGGPTPSGVSRLGVALEVLLGVAGIAMAAYLVAFANQA